VTLELRTARAEGAVFRAEWARPRAGDESENRQQADGAAREASDHGAPREEVALLLRHAPCRAPQRRRVSQDNDLAISEAIRTGERTMRYAYVRVRLVLSQAA
jgi:hypothetical protein